MNSVSIVGRLTRDPELRFTSQGTAVANLRLARNERHGDKDQPVYVDIVAWQRQAENVAQFKKKGSSCTRVGNNIAQMVSTGIWCL